MIYSKEFVMIIIKQLNSQKIKIKLGNTTVILYL